MDRYQQQRFELKYVIAEDVALAVRDFVGCHLNLDPFGAKFEDLSYPVHSLYLDSEDLALYQSTINGEKNRYKLRIRFYESEGDLPLFFEIKRRHNNIISKCRAKVKRSALEPLLQWDEPNPDYLIEPNMKQFDDLRRFCDISRRILARPRSQISYRREAWLPDDGNSVRVTFDRDVRTAIDFDAHMQTDLEEMTSVFGDSVILELKFTDRFPAWLQEMVRCFGLRQMSAAKYVEGITSMGEEVFLLPSGRNSRLAAQASQEAATWKLA